MNILFHGRSICDKKSCRMTGFGFLSTLWIMVAFAFHGLGTFLKINNNYLKLDYQNRFYHVYSFSIQARFIACFLNLKFFHDFFLNFLS